MGVTEKAALRSKLATTKTMIVGDVCIVVSDRD